MCTGSTVMILMLESKYIDSTGPVLSIYFDSNIKIITVYSCMLKWNF